MSRREMVLGAAVLIGLGFAAGAQGQETPGFTRLVLCPDVSGSLEEVAFDQSVGAVLAQLEEIVVGLGVEEVAFLPWAMPTDVLRPPAVTASVPRPSAVSAPPADDREHVKMYRHAAEEARKRRATALEAAQAEEEVRFESALREALLPIRVALENVEQGRAECTAVNAFLQRCLGEDGTLSLVITDGLNECPDPEALVPEQGGSVVVILVPSANGGRDAVLRFEERRRALESVSPRVTVIPASAVRTTSSDWLLGALARERFPDVP